MKNLSISSVFHSDSLLPRGCQQRRWPFIAAVWATLAILTVGIEFQRQQSIARFDADILAVSDSALDFGQVNAHDAFEWTVPITNISSQALSVSDIRASCSCTSISPRVFRLESGETVRIKLTIDLSATTTDVLVGSSSPFKLHIEPILNELTSLHPGWTVVGRVAAPFAISKSTVDFSNTIFRGSPFPTQTLDVDTAHGTSSLAVSGHGDHFESAIECISMGKSRVSITPRFGVPDNFDSTLYISAKSLGSAPRSRIKVRVTGRVMEDIHAWPDELLLGGCNCDTEVTTDLCVVSHSNIPFRIDRAESDFKDISVDINSADSLATHACIVRCTAKSSGPFQAILRFSCRLDANSPAINVEVPVRATIGTTRTRCVSSESSYRDPDSYHYPGKAFNR